MINLEGINKTYNPGKTGEVKALVDVNLRIQTGEMVAVMGISGSGKTTLLNIIGCLDKATSGTYELEGENMSKKYMDSLAIIRNQKIGFVLQDYGLIEDKTALENVMYPLAFRKSVTYSQMKKRALGALKVLKIDELKNKRVCHLSGGQKQRVAIARAFVTYPKVILADEPTAALDRKTSDEIMVFLRGLNIAGKTIVIVTHDKRIADLCDRIIYIEDGRITDNHI